MINLRKLMDLLPSYFREQDSYKRNNKGILERFLEVCGEYFADDISPVIDNFLDIIDIDTTSEIYLNYIWEFLGKLPYSYGAIVTGKGFESNITEVVSESQIPKADVRRLLKYAISLYKIRGTLDFYNILLKYYGFGTDRDDAVSIDDHTSGGDSPTLLSNYYDSELLYDSSEGYGGTITCEGCGKVDLEIFTTDGWATYDDDDETKQAILKRLYLLLNRFRPLNVLPFDDTNVKITYI